MGRNVWYPGLVSVVRAVLCWCSAFWLFSMTENRTEPTGIAIGAYLAFGLLCFLFFTWFLKKPRSLPLLVGSGAVASIAGCVVLLWRFADFNGFAAHFIGVVSVISVVVLSVRCWLEPPAAAKSISALEGTAMFFIFFLWAQMIFELSFWYSVPLLAATLLSMTVVVYQRISTVSGADRSRLRGIVIVVVMLAVIVAVLLLFVSFGAQPLGQGVLLLYQSVIYCLKQLMRLIEWFFLWLSTLFPDAEGELMAEPPPEIILTDGIPEEAQLPPWVLILLGTVGICLVIGAIVYVLYQLRKVRMGGRTAQRTEAVVERKKLPFGRWLRRLLKLLRDRLSLLMAQLTMRGSPQELYLYLKRAGRRLDCRQLPGETPCAFVRRAARVTAEGAEEALPLALEELATALGVCLSAPKSPPPLPKEMVRCIRRSFRRALRKARREQLRRWMAQKLSEKKSRTEEQV